MICCGRTSIILRLALVMHASRTLQAAPQLSLDKLSAIAQQGFTVYDDEWWHFDYKDWREYPILNIRFEDLPSGSHQDAAAGR